MKYKKKPVLIMCLLVLLISFFTIVTIAYFRRTINGYMTGNVGNLVLIVNEADSVKNETFNVILQRSEEEPFVYPDDRGTFNLNIDSTGSSTDVAVTITLSRINLPDNLKFYLDVNCTEELISKKYIIEKSDDMTMTIPVYWYWDGSVDDVNDSLFINKQLSANISVNAMSTKKIYDILFSTENSLDTNVDFSAVSSSTNGVGLMMRDGTQNDTYPILYYRGDVTNNNVVFADLCWLIVRTTENGGVKLIYNGDVNDDGSCNNYSGVGGKVTNSNYTDLFIGNAIKLFNQTHGSPVHSGYMYNDVDYVYSRVSLTTDYVNHLSNNEVDQETGRHIQNLKDSTIKDLIDEWYKENLLNNSNEYLIEDTVWCNDRSITSETYSIENFANNTVSMIYFGGYTRFYENTSTKVLPTLTCLRDMDKFTVDSTNGNGDLTYPIGMLTADELVFAGNTTFRGAVITTYLTMPETFFWTLTPGVYSNGYAGGIVVRTGGLNGVFVGFAKSGVRPSISLVHNTYIIGGIGTYKRPYIVG